ncbi:MAG: molybdenum cofactor guanylyltransferase [Gammaproteobacteria bacterium]|nr:molybdenum cofactor guanylyltransferase [Gammaproteobacteria bacterium]
MSCPGDLLTVVVLAGGRGSRLGDQDKGLLQWQGRPFIEHILKNIETATHNILLNANRNAEQYRQYGYPVISDEIQDYAGPLAGMHAALRAANTPFILTLPCDAPYTTSAIIEQFCEVHAKQQQSLYVAGSDDGLQPVYAMISTDLADNLEQYLAEGKRKTQAWMMENSAHVVHFDQRVTSFMNVNTETELQSLA